MPCLRAVGRKIVAGCTLASLFGAPTFLNVKCNDGQSLTLCPHQNCDRPEPTSPTREEADNRTAGAGDVESHAGVD
jgi:hypothetical protein